MMSSPPGLGPASSCAPHPPRQDGGLGAGDPRLQMAKRPRAEPGRQDPLLHRACHPLSLEHSEEVAQRGGCHALWRGRGEVMVEALRSRGRGRERLAVCPGRQQTLGPLSWDSGGAAGQMESERPGAGAGERRDSRPSHQPLPPSPHPAPRPARDPRKGSPHSHPDTGPPQAVLGLRPQRCRNPLRLGR